MKCQKKNSYDCALNLLSFRAHTEQELRVKLHKRGYHRDDIELTVIKLKQYKILDDRLFAEAYAKSRSQKLLGLNAIRTQLLNKGVGRDIIQEIIQKSFDQDSEFKKAKRLAVKYMASRKKTAGEDGIKKLAYFLLRKGYSGSVVYKITKTDVSEVCE